jgi:spore coat polysaccharide biosynthesis protein SpsF (cytidylyltransferase family)/RimJ/RimL family protein N-acetyltransferase
MKPIAIIQARMTSTRLPGKVLADLAGKPLLERMLERISASSKLKCIIVATTSNADDDAVAELAIRMGVEVFRGDEMDVLGRVHDAALKAGADPVVRLTADCPMSDPSVIDAALELYQDSGADYVSNCTTRTFPDGMDVEVMSFAALDQAHLEAQHSILREHVTPYIRGNMPELGKSEFERVDLLAEADFSHVRFTIDTDDDLKNMRWLFERLPDGFHWLEAIALASREPEKLPVMSLATEIESIELREAKADHSGVLFRWLNETDRLGSSLVTQSPVCWQDHQAWLKAYLQNEQGWLALAFHDGLPAGQVRLDQESEVIAISVYVDKLFRGRNVGQTIISEACLHAAQRWPNIPVVARVRSDNEQSLGFFASCGFVITEAHDDHLVLRPSDWK